MPTTIKEVLRLQAGSLETAPDNQAIILLRTIEKLAELAAGLSSHYARLGEETKSVTRLFPGTRETYFEHYSNKSNRLNVLAIGLNTVLSLYKLSENQEPLTEAEKAFVEGITDELPIKDCTVNDCNCAVY